MGEITTDETNLKTATEIRSKSASVFAALEKELLYFLKGKGAVVLGPSL